LSEGDIRLPKLFRQTVPQRWPGGGKTAVIELVAWSLDQACSIVIRPQKTSKHLNLKNPCLYLTEWPLTFWPWYSWRLYMPETGNTAAVCYLCIVRNLLCTRSGKRGRHGRTAGGLVLWDVTRRSERWLAQERRAPVTWRRLSRLRDAGQWACPLAGHTVRVTERRGQVHMLVPWWRHFLSRPYRRYFRVN